MSLFEESTEGKLLRLGADNEGLIKGECGHPSIGLKETESLLSIPEILNYDPEPQIEDIIFNNPSLKKYAGYNSFTETSIDYYLKPMIKKEPKTRYVTNGEHNSNYAFGLQSTLNPNCKLRIKEISLNSK